MLAFLYLADSESHSGFDCHLTPPSATALLAGGPSERSIANRQSTLRQAHGSTVLTVPEVAAATRREGRERSRTAIDNQPKVHASTSKRENGEEREI